jgi:hypothetical protein
MKQSGDFVMNTSNQIWLMLNQKSEHEGCNKQPCFNKPNETNGRFCAEHKTRNG